MIRADLDPAATGTVDPDANGTLPDIPGYFESGPICTIFGPLAANHIQEEIARIVTNHGLTMDAADKGQVSTIISQMTGIYGNGDDGSLTHPAGPALLLSRDMFFEDLKLDAGAEIDLNGCRLFVRGTLDISEGSCLIHDNGSDGSDYVGGPNGGSGGPGGGGLGIVGSGGAGGQGGNIPGGPPAESGFTGTPAGTISANGQGYGGVGGAGGNGSPGVNQVGGPGGTQDVQSTVQSPAYLPAMITGQVYTQLGRNMLAGGTGGGGGGAGTGAADPNGFGGGGGGAGGVAIVCARVILGPTAPTLASTIAAAGGDGASDITAGPSNGGGGGGGGGGTVLVTSRVRVGDPGLVVLDAGGGSGGLATIGGNGLNGAAGATFELFA